VNGKDGSIPKDAEPFVMTYEEADLISAMIHGTFHRSAGFCGLIGEILEAKKLDDGSLVISVRLKHVGNVPMPEERILGYGVLIGKVKP